MKKTLTAAAVSSVLVLGLASSALAIHETVPAETQVMAGPAKITIDGSIRERGFTEMVSTVEAQNRTLKGRDLTAAVAAVRLIGIDAYNAAILGGQTDAAAQAAADAAIRAASKGNNIFSTIIFDQATNANRNTYTTYTNAYNNAYQNLLTNAAYDSEPNIPGVQAFDYDSVTAGVQSPVILAGDSAATVTAKKTAADAAANSAARVAAYNTVATPFTDAFFDAVAVSASPLSDADKAAARFGAQIGAINASIVAGSPSAAAQQQFAVAQSMAANALTAVYTALTAAPTAADHERAFNAYIAQLAPYISMNPAAQNILADTNAVDAVADTNLTGSALYQNVVQSTTTLASQGKIQYRNAAGAYVSVATPGTPTAAEATDIAAFAATKAAGAVAQQAADAASAGVSNDGAAIGDGFTGARAAAEAAFGVARAAGQSVDQATAAATAAADSLAGVRQYHQQNQNPSRSAYDTRVRLGVKAQIADATGYIQLESGPGLGAGPNGRSNDVYTWGTASAAGLNDGGSKLGDMSILQAWIDYKPSDYGVKVGHMPLALGNKVFFDHSKFGDDAIVAYANLNEATHLAALAIKFDEQNVGDGSDDLDGYVMLGTYKASDALDFGANVTYLRGSSSGNAYTNDYDAGTFGGSLPRALVPDMAMTNVGLNGNYKVGALSFLADLEMQFGTVMDVSGFESIDANGWALKLGGTYDLGPAKVGLVYGYGTGQDETETNSDLDAFVTFLSNTNYDTIIAGYRAAIPGTFAATRDVYGVPSAMTGLSNLSLYQLNASAKTACPLTGKDLSLFASATYMHLNEDHIIGFDIDANGITDEVTGDTVGTELDLIASWALNAGLSYKVEAAYLFSGDAWDTQIIDNTEADDQYFLRHSLELKF